MQLCNIVVIAVATLGWCFLEGWRWVALPALFVGEVHFRCATVVFGDDIPVKGTSDSRGSKHPQPLKAPGATRSWPVNPRRVVCMQNSIIAQPRQLCVMISPLSLLRGYLQTAAGQPGRGPIGAPCDSRYLQQRKRKGIPAIAARLCPHKRLFDISEALLQTGHDSSKKQPQTLNNEQHVFTPQ